MNMFIPFLMLFTPGIIAVSVHNKQLINITRENRQKILWEFLLYSFAIVVVVNSFMFITNPQRMVSFSSWAILGDSNIFMPGFIVKYSLSAVVAAFALPKLYTNRLNILKGWKDHKNNIIDDDE